MIQYMPFFFNIYSSIIKFLTWNQVSTNILRKYSGPVDIWLSNLYGMNGPGGVMHCLLNEQPKKSFFAMAQHSSQWVWYVYFFFLK